MNESSHMSIHHGTSIKNSCHISWVMSHYYRVAYSHEVPYLHRSFFAKEPYNSWMSLGHPVSQTLTEWFVLRVMWNDSFEWVDPMWNDSFEWVDPMWNDSFEWVDPMWNDSFDVTQLSQSIFVCNDKWLIRMSHFTWEWIISYAWMSHVTRVKESSCYIRERVMSLAWMVLLMVAN